MQPDGVRDVDREAVAQPVPLQLAFLGVVVVAYLIPGPDFAVILRGAAESVRAGIAAAAGAQTGLCVHMLAAAVGLSLLLTRMPGALTVVQLAGAAYLLYLGVRAVLAGAGPAEERRPGSWFVQGLTTNVLNPKAILFFASVLPQFVSADAPLPPQILVLGAVDVAAGVGLWALLVLAASRLSGVLARPRIRRRVDRATGGVFIGMGSALALTRL